LFQVEILTIGNEILAGEVLDTNTHWVCQQLQDLGGNVLGTSLVRDRVEDIAQALRSTLSRDPDVVITMGGLGPTADDLTLAGVAEALGIPLELHPQALSLVRQRYDTLSRQGSGLSAGLNPARQKMARLPRGSHSLPNPVGTAPGVRLAVGAQEVICLPGVPAEMKGIFQTEVQMHFHQRFGAGAYARRDLLASCSDESLLAPVLEKVSRAHPKVYIKSRARPFEEGVPLRLTLTSRAEKRAKADENLGHALRALKGALSSLGIELEEKAGLPQHSEDSNHSG
jgi:molybdenum cofactor synthesis domain-containing protein